MIDQAPEPIDPAILALVQQRSRARSDRDFAAADALRDRLREAGWIVADTPQGATLRRAPRWPVHATLAEIGAGGAGSGADGGTAEPGARAADPAAAPEVVVDILVSGWPEDLAGCVEALLTHAPRGTRIHLLDLGDVDGGGVAAEGWADTHPGIVSVTHVAVSLSQAGWGPAVTAMLAADPAEVHVIIDTATVLTGDALSPLIELLRQPGVVAAGWRGVMVDRADGWQQWHDAPAGEVDALLSYLLVVHREAGLAAPPHHRARSYRNADLEWSLAMRAAGGRLIALGDRLPVVQGRHRGYHDSDQVELQRESRRTYERLLRRFRGREDILAPRPASQVAQQDDQ